MKESKPILQVRGLSKSFPGVKALSNVDFSLRPGEIHGLVGENGAGKSTLIKIITGFYKKDEGEILLDGKNLQLHSPAEAATFGISTVYQEINLIPYLTVAENIFLGRQPVSHLGKINWKQINLRAQKALQKLDIHIDVTQPLSSYSVAIQQMIAIARALDISAKILILDEPTSSLDPAEVNQLFSVMKKLKNDGIGIIFITHFLDQIYRITDTITVLRNGELVGEYTTRTLPHLKLVEKMLGKELSEFELTVKEKKEAEREVFYQVKDMEMAKSISSFDLDIREAEVLGLAGLLGSGRTEIARLLFGIDQPHKGKRILNGKEIVNFSPRKAVENSFGFCPEDRKADGLIPNLTVRENIILALQARKGIFKTLSRKKQDEIAKKYIDVLRISLPSSEQLVKNLSGGNQQKVIIARWLASEPKFLILDEPTRGIDVGAKAEIQKIILLLSREGMAILFISSEIEEVIRCSDRVVILRDRKKLAELTGREINERTIMHTIAKGVMSEREPK
jgi:monosaccharide-transporting ATPase